MKSWRIAARSLGRRPGFTLTAVVLLALGVAVDTALFSVVDTMILGPLPFPEPSQLVTVMEASTAGSQKVSLVAPVRIEEWSRMSRSFSAISGSYSENVTDTSGLQPERLTGRRVAALYFDVYRMPALVGRTFTPDEEVRGGPAAAVISHGLWARRYGMDPQVTSRRLVVDGRATSIVGVMPKTFAAPATDVWIPAQLSTQLRQMRSARFYSGIGRMKPGVTLEQAQSDLAAVQRALGEEHPATDRGWSAVLTDLKAARVGEAGRPILLLFGAVGLLLVIAVSSVATLVLAQFHHREREFAIRRALGATRAQVMAPALRETVLIAAAGGAGGYAAARLSLDLVAKVFADTPRVNELAIDWRALVFALGTSCAAVLAFGLLPALHATGSRCAGTLVHAGRGAGAARQWAQRTLIGGQLALTMLLLSGAGLLARSFYNLTRVELGFDPSGAVVFHVGAAWDEDRRAIGRMQEQLIAELKRLPGVAAAGMTNFLPASGATLRNSITLEGMAEAPETGRTPVGYRRVSPGYLQALQVPLVAGSWCPELVVDPPGGRKLMVNRRFVQVYGRGENVIGRHVGFSGYPGAAQPEIVGVIGDMREDALGAPPYPYLYDCARGGDWPDPEYLVRGAGDPAALLRSIRETVRAVAPGRALFGVQRLEDALDATLDRPRSTARLVALFAGAALALAAVGLYGLVSQVVSTRRREIGIRIALGAAPGRVVFSAAADTGALIAAGLAAGLGLTIAAQPVLRTLLFEVGPLDLPSLAAAAALLAAVASLAAIVPARRAAAIDPVECMRAE